MNQRLKRLRQTFSYLGWLLLWVAVFMLITFEIYLRLEGFPLYVYMGNVLLIALILVGDKAETSGWEKLYNKLSEDNAISRFLKRKLKKYLAGVRYRPTPKAGLYLFYIVCLIAGRVLYYTNDVPFMGVSTAEVLKDYFSGMYYVLILLLAMDKFTQHITKESKYTQSYYAKYDEDGGETPST